MFFDFLEQRKKLQLGILFTLHDNNDLSHIFTPKIPFLLEEKSSYWCIEQMKLITCTTFW